MAHPLSNAFHQFARNERWGTCVDCPRDGDGRVLPELCVNTRRYDHNLKLDGLVAAYSSQRRKTGE